MEFITDYLIETGTYQTVDGSKVNTEEKIETDHKTTTAEQNEGKMKTFLKAKYMETY